MDFRKWPKIQQFHNIRKELQAKKEHAISVGKYDPTYTKRVYTPKIKLDGTNAAIQFKDGKIQAQSRSRMITPEDDNYGFARWVEQVARNIL